MDADTSPGFSRNPPYMCETLPVLVHLGNYEPQVKQEALLVIAKWKAPVLKPCTSPSVLFWSLLLLKHLASLCVLNARMLLDEPFVTNLICAFVKKKIEKFIHSLLEGATSWVEYLYSPVTVLLWARIKLRPARQNHAGFPSSCNSVRSWKHRMHERRNSPLISKLYFSNLMRRATGKE